MTTLIVNEEVMDEVRADPLLSVENFAVEFATGHGWSRVVDDVSFSVRAGETMGLVGESGSGKSVTAMSIMRLIPTPPGRIAAGRILFEGQDLLALDEPQMRKVRGNHIAMIFQEPLTALNPAFTIGDQLVEAIRAHRKVTRKQAGDRAAELLDLVGIPGARQRLRDYPHRFSGGMLQRAMIAGALACSPKLLIADEPTTALDVTVQAQILTLLRGLQQEFNMAMLFISHDLGVVADICDRVAVMYAGQIVESATVYELFERPLHPYTEGLLLAMPQHGKPTDRLVPIPGVVPEAASVADRCRFETRCRYAADECRAAPVPLTSYGPRATRCVRSKDLVLGGTS
ncbi:ABC transporter ATP-binding protein [Acrocarpospora macrocephala]|uniref:ABC transporter ATP-binding protein n=2 Tax=Acrocarpospora macrocephala TaxID=150177 RepID=A0A5M3WH46_9ACTN|nr:ABC transporter ATP-binding protein [Acrocarpospora macrocephala]